MPLEPPPGATQEEAARWRAADARRRRANQPPLTIVTEGTTRETTGSGAKRKPIITAEVPVKEVTVIKPK